MKVLVAYESHHGFTPHCLKLLADELSADWTLWNASRNRKAPAVEEFDAILVGGAVYFGRWAPRPNRWLKTLDPARLAQKPVGAFVVSLSPKAAALRYFSQSLAPNWKGHLGHVACFGGRIDWKGLQWWEKFMLKNYLRIETDVSNLDHTALQALAAWLQKPKPAPEPPHRAD